MKMKHEEALQLRQKLQDMKDMEMALRPKNRPPRVPVADAAGAATGAPPSGRASDGDGEAGGGGGSDGPVRRLTRKAGSSRSVSSSKDGSSRSLSTGRSRPPPVVKKPVVRQQLTLAMNSLSLNI